MLCLTWFVTLRVSYTTAIRIMDEGAENSLFVGWANKTVADSFLQCRLRIVFFLFGVECH